MQTLTDIRSLLDAHGLSPRKRLGQCFLHDRHHMERVVSASGVAADERVLEVGPGTGSLSECLLEAGARLVAVEADERFRPLLEQRLLGVYGDRVRLLFRDVLAGKHRLDPELVELVASADGGFALVSNLPYGVASPLLMNLLASALPMRYAVVMVQSEVADRLVARPGTKSYGPLGVMGQALAEVEVVARVPPTAFWPEPAVDSALVRLRPRAERVVSPAALARLTRRLFSQRRKTLRRILGSDPAWPEGVTGSMRPEQLTVAQLAELAARREESAGSGEEA